MDPNSGHIDPQSALSEFHSSTIPEEPTSDVKLGLIVSDEVEDEDVSVCVSGYFPWLPPTPAPIVDYRPPPVDPDHMSNRLSKAEDLTGQIFGLLRVDGVSGTGTRGFSFQCTCTGCKRTIANVRASKLTSGMRSSCGKWRCKLKRIRDGAKAA